MFCYIANFILWITGVITDSIIFCFAFDAKNEEIKRWKLIAGLVAGSLRYVSFFIIVMQAFGHYAFL